MSVFHEVKRSYEKTGMKKRGKERVTREREREEEEEEERKKKRAPFRTLNWNEAIKALRAQCETSVFLNVFAFDFYPLLYLFFFRPSIILGNPNSKEEHWQGQATEHPIKPSLL